MGAQDYPRLYISGHLEANPATGNNNDYFFNDAKGKAVTYLGGKVDLNWELIGQPKPTVGADNVVPPDERRAIREWFITPRKSTSSGVVLPAEWNNYGGNQMYFVQYEGDSSNDKPPRFTKPVGGALSANQAASLDDDPFFDGAFVFLAGDGNQGDGWPTVDNLGNPPRLVDVDPLSTWSTQIFFAQIYVGKQGCGIVMDRTALFQLRYYAGQGSWQTAVEKGPGLVIENPPAGDDGHSPLLAAFQTALDQDDVKGLVFAFHSVLLSPEDLGGLNRLGDATFNNGQYPYAIYDGQDQLAALYKRQLDLEFATPVDRSKLGLYCPCYPSAIGTVGVWRSYEALRTAPEGRYLFNSSNGFVVASVTGAGSPEDRGQLHVSFQNQRKLAGSLEVGIVRDGGSFSKVLDFDLTPEVLGDRESGGIVDIDLTESQVQTLNGSPLELQLRQPAQSSSTAGRTPPVTVVDFTEQPLAANTDQRSIYGDAGDPTLHPVTVAVTDRGMPAAAGTSVLVVKYTHAPSPQISPTIVDKSDPAQAVELTDSEGNSIERTVGYTSAAGPGETEAAILQTDECGQARFAVRALDHGFVVLTYLPYSGDAPPTPSTPLNPPNFGYTCLRIWPDDSADRSAFVEVWNEAIGGGKDAARHAAWKFVYENILYLYDLLYPVMYRFLPLHDLDELERKIQAFAFRVGLPFENTMLMPVTRDLSSGKKWVLEKWASLVHAGYPLEPISVDD